MFTLTCICCGEGIKSNVYIGSTLILDKRTYIFFLACILFVKQGRIVLAKTNIGCYYANENVNRMAEIF